MSDNTTLDTGSGGDAIVTREISHAGDTAKLPGSFLMGISGTEGSYTAAAIGGDASNGIDVDVTRVGGTVAVTQSGTWDEVGINDSGNSITVDAPVGTPVFVRLSDGSSAIATLPVSLASLPALAAGTNNIGDVDILSIAAGDNNIGNVDVVTLPALAAGTNNIGDVDVLSIAAGTNTIGNVVPVPATSGGLSIARDIDLDNGTLTVVKGSAGQLYGWHITNTSTVTVFVKFYDATSGTLGTGTPVLTIGIPGNASDDTLAMAAFGGMGVAFATGISVGAGTGVADADNTDPGANAVVANFYYK